MARARHPDATRERVRTMVKLVLTIAAIMFILSWLGLLGVIALAAVIWWLKPLLIFGAVIWIICTVRDMLPSKILRRGDQVIIKTTGEEGEIRDDFIDHHNHQRIYVVQFPDGSHTTARFTDLTLLPPVAVAPASVVR